MHVNIAIGNSLAELANHLGAIVSGLICFLTTMYDVHITINVSLTAAMNFDGILKSFMLLKYTVA